MTEEEELKNLLNAKLSQGEVPFDEENWEHAEKLIDDSRKKKKRRRWAIIFFIGLGAGIAVMLPFALHSYKNSSDNSDTKQIQPIKQSTDTSLKKNNNPASVKENNNAVTAQKADSVPVHAALSEATNSAAAASDIKESKGKTTATDIAAIPAKHKATNTTQTNNNESSIGTSPAEASVKTTATKNKTVTLATNSSSNNEPKVKMSSTAKTDNYPINSKDTSAASASVKPKETQKEKTVKNNTIADTTAVVTTSKPAEKQTQTDTVPEKNDAAIVSKKQEPVSQNNAQAKTDSLQVVATQKQAQAKADSVQKTNETVATTKKDTAAKKTDTAKTITPQPDKPRTSEKDVLSVEAGTNFVTGWSYGNTTEGRGFNPIVGIGYTHIINPTWSVHTGVFFNTIGYLSSSTYTDSHTNYDFGYTAKDTSITTKWLYYITVPLQLQYNLDEKNYIGIGGTLSYLINSSGTITTYNQNSFTVTNKQTVAQTGYYNGFNSWNATVMALYGRKLTSRLSASLTAYFGLMDIKSNSVFAEQKFERETGLRILVSYNIFQ